ncbi:site-specific integrase [Salmonella enterica subsp. diarizonae]|nr:site-specific integrase [Salmonella enterica subsp. diarizonae]EJI6717228.1 site-specific integrase [Salmonella enterica]
MGDNHFIASFQNEVMYAKDKSYNFNLYNNNWIIGKRIVFNFEIVDSVLPENFKFIFRNVMATFAQNYSASYAKKMFWSAYNFFRRNKRCQWEEITQSDLKNYYSLTYNENYTYVESIKYFFIKWYELGFLGIKHPTYVFLRSWKIKKKNVGKAVRTLDPEGGPLTDEELNELHSKAVKGYKDGKINLFDFALLNILLCTGRRPLQVSQLKCCDMKEHHGKFYLKIPRIKQGQNFRQDFKSVEIPRGLYEIICMLIQESISVFESRLSLIITDRQFNSLPLFPEYSKFEVDDLYFGNETYDDDYLHVHSEKISRRLKFICIANDIRSHRTSKILKLNSRRLRYTLGSRAAREGCDAYMIAHLLDHSSTKTVQTYINNLPENAKRIDSMLSVLMLPYANEFCCLEAIGSRYWFDNIFSRIKILLRQIKPDGDIAESLHHSTVLIEKSHRAKE